MKKILVTIALALTFGGMTTGCAAKKRVKRLEAELSRCRAEKKRLQKKVGGELEEQQHDADDRHGKTYAVRTEPESQ